MGHNRNGAASRMLKLSSIMSVYGVISFTLFLDTTPHLFLNFLLTDRFNLFFVRIFCLWCFGFLFFRRQRTIAQNRHAQRSILLLVFSHFQMFYSYPSLFIIQFCLSESRRKKGSSFYGASRIKYRYVTTIFLFFIVRRMLVTQTIKP